MAFFLRQPSCSTPNSTTKQAHRRTGYDVRLRQFEGCLKAEKGGRYPVCVEGERNCPPEDVGGVWSYAEFLEAVANPKHEQHDEFVEWAGEFDTEQFAAIETTNAMRRGLPDWR